MADGAADSGKGFVIERRVEQTFRQIRTQRAAHLHRTNRPARGAAAAEVVQQFAQGHAEGLLHQTAVFQVAGQLHRQ